MEEKNDMSTLFNKEKVTTYTYNLTNKGKEYYINNIRYGSFLSKSEGGFIYAQAKIDKIMSKTEPANLLGKIVTEVVYEYHYENIADWLVMDELSSVNKVKAACENVNQETMKDKAPLIKTDDGWIHQWLYDQLDS